MNTELIEAIKLLEKERGIDAEVLFQSIEEALVSAYKREFDAKVSDNIRAEVDRETGEMQVFLEKEVVDQVEDPNMQIALSDALQFSPDFELGDVVEYQLSPQDFGRLAAATAKNVINQKLCNAEKERIQREFSSRINELASGVVQRRDRREVIVDIGRAEAVLPAHEQVRTDSYEFNTPMRLYILRVDEKMGRPVIYVSRSHPNLVRKLFEQEVPEIQDGSVEIVSVAREAGSRTKIAVRSNEENVDPLGSCVGQRGIRVQAIIDELNGERIDVILWHPDVAEFVANALSPARVSDVQVDEENHVALVVVPDNQLALAIGREGQNARLAARLVGWKVDIKSESSYRQLVEERLMAQFNKDNPIESDAETAATEADSDEVEADS